MQTIKFIIIFFNCLVFLISYCTVKHYNEGVILNKNLTLVKDPITIVTALYKIKSKYSSDFYLKWVENLLKLDKPIIFFIDPSIANIIKSKRSNKYENKTIWVELEMKDFYTYQKYLFFFKKAYKIDEERKENHTIELYLIWAEKVVFLKKAIDANLFSSFCFYWIDAGLLRESNYSDNFLEQWPSTKRCFEDPRVTFFSMRNLTLDEIENFKSLKIKKSYF